MRHIHSTAVVQRFRGGLVFKAHTLCVSLNSRLQSNKEEEEGCQTRPQRARMRGETRRTGPNTSPHGKTNSRQRSLLSLSPKANLAPRKGTSPVDRRSKTDHQIQAGGLAVSARVQAAPTPRVENMARIRQSRPDSGLCL